MKNILITIMITLLICNDHGGEPLSQESNPYKLNFMGEEYTIEELGLPSGSRIIPIQGWYINGYQITPKEVKHKGVIVVFGGSEGSSALGDALTLAIQGYEVYSMYFYGQENQRKKIDRIPLEFFAELYLHIQKNARLPKPLTIQGVSKGSELALLLASYYSDYVDNLILYAPIAYVFQGHGKGQHSAWTFQGKELTFISLEAGEELKTKHLIARKNNKPRRGIELYQYGLEHDENKEKARINLTSIRSKMLIFAGELDEACPAADMGREIKANYKGECELVTFEKVGHWFLKQNTYGHLLMMGGEPEANVQAGIESDRIRLEKLAEWTK